MVFRFIDNLDKYEVWVFGLAAILSLICDSVVCFFFFLFVYSHEPSLIKVMKFVISYLKFIISYFKFVMKFQIFCWL